MGFIYRVTATAATTFTQVVEADSPAEAATQLGNMIRAGEVEPISGPVITDIAVLRGPERWSMS